MSKDEKLLYYIAFVLFAAPVEIVLSLSFGIANNDARAIAKPVGQALLYLYAFILTSETMLRMALNRDKILTPLLRGALTINSWAVLSLFGLHYLLTLFPRVEHGTDVSQTWLMQAFALFLAMFGSILSYQVIENGPATKAAITL